jgi:hypothetical protein
MGPIWFTNTIDYLVNRKNRIKISNFSLLRKSLPPYINKMAYKAEQGAIFELINFQWAICQYY